MRFPVLQSFEKDTTKVNFTINQLSRGLDDTIANGEISITAFPGIDLTGVTECSAAIQFAIDSLNILGSHTKTLTIPAGSVLKIATGLHIGNGTSSAVSTQQGIRIKGMGMPSSAGVAATPANTPVKFLWSGGAGTMFTIAGPLVGWGLENLLFDGASLAMIGLFVRCGQFGHCQNLTIIGCRGQSLYLDTFANVNFPTFGQSNAMHNTFINTWIILPDVAGATGVLLTGSNPGGAVTPANACYNTFVNTILWFTGTLVKLGIQFQGSDCNYFTNTHCVNGTNSAGITWDYTVFNGWPASNHLDGVDTGGCAVHFQNGGTPGSTATPNYVRLFETNGATCPVLANQVCLNRSVGLSVTAAGVNQATATGLIAMWNVVTSVAVGTGVRLNCPTDGTEMRVYNAGANNLNVYPPVGVQIDGLAVNAPFVLVPGKHQVFSRWSLNTYLSFTAISLG